MAVFDTESSMNKPKAVLFSLLMIAASLAGCIGGEDVDTSDYENQIAEKDKSIDELESIIINQNERATIPSIMSLCYRHNLNSQSWIEMIY